MYSFHNGDKVEKWKKQNLNWKLKDLKKKHEKQDFHYDMENDFEPPFWKLESEPKQTTTTFWNSKTSATWVKI